MAMIFDFDTQSGALAGAVKHDDGVHLELIDSGPVNIEALADWLAGRWRGLGMITIWQITKPREISVLQAKTSFP